MFLLSIASANLKPSKDFFFTMQLQPTDIKTFNMLTQECSEIINNLLIFFYIRFFGIYRIWLEVFFIHKLAITIVYLGVV